MKVLFLDFDGVLNRFSPIYQIGKVKGLILISSSSTTPILPELVAILNKIIQATNCEIVVSSSWRMSHTILLLDKYLQDAGFIGSILSITPLRSNNKRGDEVQAWLKAHSTEKYAILDDHPDWFLEHQQPFIVPTLSNVGLTDEIADEIVKLLDDV